MREPVVLCYHAVSASWSTPLTVTPRRLESHIRALLRAGMRPATFSDALLAPRHERTFVVTFDDAYRSVRELALPILQRLDVPATLFVPTGWAGTDARRAAWAEMEQWHEAGHLHELDLMPWEAIRALADAGWEIGSHSHEHPRLTEVDDETLDDELRRSRALVEDALGRRCLSIAYPFGDVDGRVVAAAARAGYRTGAALPSALPTRTRPPSTPLAWPRIGLYPSDHLLRFAAKVAGSMMVGAGLAPPAVPDPLPPDEPPVPALGAGAAPRVAVVIPCFNDGPLTKEAVASVREGEPVEIVVVDDASTEADTAAALDELRRDGVRVLRHDANQGLSAARRTGLAATTAPYVFPLDADDLLVAGVLGRLADRLDGEPAAAATWGDVEEFGTRDRRGTLPLRLDPYRVAYRNDYPVCSLFRRDALERVGAWQDVGGMVGYEDWNLWMTFAERGDLALHAGHGVLAVRRRLHGPRMLGDSARRHRALYAELRRTHPRLFAEIGRHRRASTMSWPRRIAYPLLFGGRPPLGIRNAAWALSAAVRRRLRRAR